MISNDTILSSKLAYDYLDWPDFWMDVRPLTHARQLALINPGEGEAQYYRSLGWDVRVFVFSQGLIVLWHQLGAPANWLSLRDLTKGDWSLLSEMDAVVINRSFAIVEDPSVYIDHILSLIPDHATLHVQIDNARYFQFILNTSSREIVPCRNYYTKTRPYTREQIEEIFARLSHVKSVEWEEFRDDQYFHPNRDSYRTITAPDCFVRLPNGPNRLDYFIKTFRLKVQGEQDVLAALPNLFNKTAQAQTAAQTLEPVNPSAISSEEALSSNEKTSTFEALKKLALGLSTQKEFHQQDQVVISPLESVEQALQVGNVDRARELFASIESNPQGVEPHALHNMRGLLAFYSQNPQQAYLHFIDALELEPGNGDYFLNLMDAGIQLGRGAEVMRLFKMSLTRHPSLKEIETEIEGLLGA